jgi:predicted DNA binding CopG/RHH family protein
MSRLATDMTSEEIDAVIAKQELDQDEQEIEDALVAGTFKKGEGLSERLQEWKQALQNTERKLPISMRVSSRIVNRIKLKARDEGIPYQTLINSVLHKFANGRLVERD